MDDVNLVWPQWLQQRWLQYQTLADLLREATLIPFVGPIAEDIIRIITNGLGRPINVHRTTMQFEKGGPTARAGELSQIQNVLDYHMLPAAVREALDQYRATAIGEIPVEMPTKTLRDNLLRTIVAFLIEKPAQTLNPAEHQDRQRRIRRFYDSIRGNTRMKSLELQADAILANLSSENVPASDLTLYEQVQRLTMRWHEALWDEAHGFTQEYWDYPQPGKQSQLTSLCAIVAASK